MLSLDIASRLCCCFSLVHRRCWHVEEDGRCAACGADTRCVIFFRFRSGVCLSVC